MTEAERATAMTALGELHAALLRAKLNPREHGNAPVEAIARALRAARASSTGWVPVGTPPTGEDRYVLAAIRGGIIDRWHWTERAGFTGMGGPVIAWQEMPEFPGDGETGGGRG